MLPHYFVLQNIGYNDIEKYDVFNKNKTHSIFSEPNSNYNCLAYVLGAYAWLHPIGVLSELDDGSNENISNEMFVENVAAIISALGIEDNNELVSQDIYNALYEHDYSNCYLMEYVSWRLLHCFRGIRRIHNLHELKDDEYAIIYAACYNDYHFIKYDNGIYTHKIGDGAVEEAEDEEQAFSTKYTSIRYYFAMKKNLVGNYEN